MNTRVDAINWWALLTDQAFLTDPYPHLRALREQAPVD